MERIRRYYLLALAAILLLLAGNCAYMEHHFTTWTMVDSGWSEERILKKMPDIAITEEDLVLRDNVLAIPEVEAALERAIEYKEAMAALGKTPEFSAENGIRWTAKEPETLLPADFLKDDRMIGELAVTNSGIVCLSYVDGGMERVYYTFFTTDGQPIRKTVGIDPGWMMKPQTVYENDNGVITRFVMKRVWFDWLFHGV